jgi:hypothetical protein
VVESPAEASLIAAERPLGPEPMIVAVGIKYRNSRPELSFDR